MKSSLTHELSVGAPGLDDGAGAIFVFTLKGRVAYYRARLDSPEPGGSAFGFLLTYGVDTNGDGTRDIVAGGTDALFVLSTRVINRSSMRRWARIALSVVDTATAKEPT